MAVNDLFYRPPGSLMKSALHTRVDIAREQKALNAKRWRAVCKAVDARDKRTCRCCGKATDPNVMGLLRGHRHHIVYRSAGGQDDSANIVTLCARCHADVHINRMRIEGNANESLVFCRR